MEKISTRITDSLIEAGAVPVTDKALYEYGIRMGILTVINIATAILIGAFFGMIWQCIVFLIAYSPIRTYAGGYHAKSPLNCYLLSIPMMVLVLLGIKMISWNSYMIAIPTACALIALGLLAPLADPNKPLYDVEKNVYKRKVRFFSAVFFCAAIVLWYAGLYQISLSIVMALTVAAILLILGAVVNGNKPKVKAQ